MLASTWAGSAVLQRSSPRGENSEELPLLAAGVTTGAGEKRRVAARPEGGTWEREFKSIDGKETGGRNPNTYSSIARS